MKYWLLRGRERTGPFEPADLVKAPGFNPSALVCPEGKRLGDRRNWRQARKCKDIEAACRTGARPASPSPLPRPPAPAPVKPRLIEESVDLVRDEPAAPAPEPRVRGDDSEAPWWSFVGWAVLAGGVAALILALAWPQSSDLNAKPGLPARLSVPAFGSQLQRPATPPSRLYQELETAPLGALFPGAPVAGPGDFSFADFREVLSGLAQDPDFGPLADEFSLRFSAESRLWEHYLDFALAARRGQRRRAVDFVKPLLLSPEFLRLDARLSSKASAPAALRILATASPLEPFWTQWRSEGALPMPLQERLGSVSERAKLYALLAANAPARKP